MDVDPRQLHDLLTAVKDAERAIWTPGATSEQIDQRNHAAHAAMTAGWTAEQIADELGVTPDDVRRWISPGQNQL